MKALVKVGFVAVVLALLSGCTQTALTKSESGIVNKPVDVRGMTKELREWQVDGARFNVQVFLDKNGQYYDEDGITATKDGYRILADGQVCKPTTITLFNHYIKKFNNGDLDLIDCSLDVYVQKGEKTSRIIGGALGGGLALGVVGVAGGVTSALGAGTVSDAITQAEALPEIEKIGYVYVGDTK